MKKIHFKFKNIFFILLSVAVLSWGIVYTNCGSNLEISENQNSNDPTQNDLSDPTCLKGTPCKPKIATGGMHTCILLNGLVECWGDNSMGQLGNGTTANSSTPVAVPNLTGVTAIEAGRNETCVIAAGVVKCWGDNTFGQLGNGTTGGFSSSPVTVSNLTGATAVSVGGHHACAINGSQKVKCWGFNNVGQLGLNNMTNFNTPQLIPTLSNVIAISAGVAHSCAIVSGGTAQCWGYNGLGQLGIGAQVANKLVPTPVINLTSATAIESGQYHTCALKSNNTIKCWGDNSAGQLGGGTPMVQKSLSPIPVVTITNAIALDLGEHHSCANVSGGNTKCWGENNNGQLGNGVTSIYPTPTPVSANILINSTEIEAGGSHTCVVNNSKVNCWGNNANGQLGNGTNNSPQLIPGIPLTTLVCNTCSWQSTSLVNAPSPRLLVTEDMHYAVWTGSRFFIWGGRAANTSSAVPLGDGGLLDPISNTWTTISTIGAPSPRFGHSVVWAGQPVNRVIVFGGTSGGSVQYNDGALFDPISNTWTPMSTVGAPTAVYHRAVWTGSEMITWGGQGFPQGAKYNPVSNAWTPISFVGAPAVTYDHSMVWAGPPVNKVIVWGGMFNSNYLNSGGVYDPIANAWSATSLTNAPSPRATHLAVWTGSEMIIWKGFAGGPLITGGGKYNPTTNTWSAMNSSGPSASQFNTGVWSGTQMIVWGNVANDSYNPVTDSWTPNCSNGAPLSVAQNFGVWTGAQMIVWGGDPGGPTNTGGIYTP